MKSNEKAPLSERICRALTVQWMPMSGMETEIVLVNEDLGY